MNQNQLPNNLSFLQNILNLDYSFNRLYFKQTTSNTSKVFFYSHLVFYILFTIFSLFYLTDPRLFVFLSVTIPILISYCFKSLVENNVVIDLNDNTFYTEYSFLFLFPMFITKKIKLEEIFLISNNTFTFPYIRKTRFINPLILNSKTNLYHKYGLCLFFKDGTMKNIVLENIDYLESVDIANSFANYLKIQNVICQEYNQIKSFTKTQNITTLNEIPITYTSNIERICIYYKYVFLLFLIFSIFWGIGFETIRYSHIYQMKNYGYLEYLISCNFGIDSLKSVYLGLIRGLLNRH